MKKIALFIIMLLLFSCKTAQKASIETNHKENLHVGNDIHLINDNKLSAIADKLVERLLNEKLNIQIDQTKYDTNKPVDENTGRPPVMEENKININRETNEKHNEETHEEKNSRLNTELTDNSQLDANTDISDKVTDKKGLATWQKALMCIGAFSIIALVVGVIWKLK